MYIAATEVLFIKHQQPQELNLTAVKTGVYHFYVVFIWSLKLQKAVLRA